MIELGQDLVVAVQLLGGDDVAQGLANKVIQMVKTVLIHPVHQTISHVLDDTITILHNTGGNLNVAAAQQQELQSVAPGLNAADAGDGDALQAGIRQHVGAETQSDGLHSRAGVTGDGGLAVDDGHRGHVLQVDVGDGLHGVDSGQTGSAALDGSHSGRAHIRDVGGHLCDEGDLGYAGDGLAVGLHQCGVGTNVRTHLVRGHLGAGEVALDQVGADLVAHLGQLLPLGLAGAHDGGDHDLVGEVLLQTVHEVKVLLSGLVGDLLHVLEAQPGSVFLAGDVETGRALVRHEDTDGLEEHAAPASLIGLGDHVVVAADRGGRQEKRILALYAQIINRQIFLNSHDSSSFPYFR